MNAKKLPVYQQKEKILTALDSNQVIIVQSPTGSGKTTQLPIILHEAGYTKHGMIGVTQPRRIATLGVCEFIARQLKESVGGVIGYKMRFEDKTTPSTALKIMTDGILLQEIKSDPLLSAYTVIMVDEAHERSLNIDFILGLLKKVIENRTDFKVIISSATINSAIFSQYFNDAPTVTIETQMYPVSVLYDCPQGEGEEELLQKIVSVCNRIILDEKRHGDILIFLPGEKQIKMVMRALAESRVKNKIITLPLYGMLGKEEQERIFLKTPLGKTKIIVSTNIAETSITIEGITSVIDSGRSKENRYNLKSFTSSLIDTSISQASANQRKGRAGRTQTGYCYRLYSKSDFDSRPLFTTEEIYRTDLSEVVLRMAGLGIEDFMSFHFISQPNAAGIRSSVETLKLLEALDQQGKLTRYGELMLFFPLLPRHARIIVEAMHHYPSVLAECCIITSFLSTNSPYLLPQGEELEARKAHHFFRGEEGGDFSSYINLFNAFLKSKDPENFCTNYYLDKKTLDEIVNVERQLEDTASTFGAVIAGGGKVDDYLTCCGKGLIQFVCVLDGRDIYKSLTADHIIIHPGSVMFKEKAKFIIAGEIMKTTRLYARSVSPITLQVLERISPFVSTKLIQNSKILSQYPKEKTIDSNILNSIVIGKTIFPLIIKKGKNKKKFKKINLDWSDLQKALLGQNYSDIKDYKNLIASLFYHGDEVMTNVRLNIIIRTAFFLNIEQDILASWPQKRQFYGNIKSQFEQLSTHIHLIGKICFGTKKGVPRQFLGFLSLCNDGHGAFWFKPLSNFTGFINESISSLEILADIWPEDAEKEAIAQVGESYRKLSTLSED